MKLVDMLDLGSSAARRVGSSPSIRTKEYIIAEVSTSAIFNKNRIQLESTHSNRRLRASNTELYAHGNFSKQD